ncbi:NAD(P)-binding protein [Peniophora sp. CONT]|nr:NAD(P)-binding protein [Peniophora sp. CONT]
MIQKVENTKQLVWLVTGASSGLGLALVKRILARGDRVIATARTPSKLATLLPSASPDQLHAVHLDVTAPFADIQHIIDSAALHWGRIDVLVNNAGLIDTIGPGEELGTTDVFERVMATNFFGVVKCSNAVLPHMRARKAGTVVIVGSRSAYKTEVMGAGAYCASKAAVHAYGETLSAEVRSLNIRVTIIIPGLFRTSFNCPSITSPSIADYKSFHDTAPSYLKKRQSDSNAADPVKGMDVVVDVVRGEGRGMTEGKNGQWPLWVVLGDDALVDVRERLSKLGETMKVWEDVGRDLMVE